MFKTNNTCIYYNLEPLMDYLIETGNFKDPITRIAYTNKHLKQMDDIYAYKKTDKTDKKSVVAYSKCTEHYIQKKRLENELYTLEGILDYINEEIMTTIRNASRTIVLYNLSIAYDFQNRIIMLYNINEEKARYTIDKYIRNLLHYISKETIPDHTLASYDSLLVYLYTMREICV